MVMGLAERLTIRRTQCGLSQRAVAKQLGVSPSIISGYETGERTPSVEKLLQLAGLYRCSADYLLGIGSQSTDTVSLAGLTASQRQLVIALLDALRGAGA